MKHKLQLLKGNQGFVIDLNDYRLSSTRHNGVMKVIASWEVNEKDIRTALKKLNKEEEE